MSTNCQLVVHQLPTHTVPQVPHSVGALAQGIEPVRFTRRPVCSSRGEMALTLKLALCAALLALPGVVAPPPDQPPAAQPAPASNLAAWEADMELGPEVVAAGVGLSYAGACAFMLQCWIGPTSPARLPEQRKSTRRKP